MTIVANDWKELIYLLESAGVTLTHIQRFPMRVNGQWTVDILA